MSKTQGAEGVERLLGEYDEAVHEARGWGGSERAKVAADLRTKLLATLRAQQAPTREADELERLVRAWKHDAKNMSAAQTCAPF